MTNRLQELLDEARKNVSTSQDKEEQRPSIIIPINCTILR
jgi:hypothetical protein